VLTDTHGRKIPTVYVIKPNRVRYWIRSSAFRDADEVVADMLVWGSSKEELIEEDAPHV
jgi:hypothetical protein